MIFANPMHRPCPWEVGDILTTENATPPAQRWPGTQWVQITDRFLYGSTAAGTEGGEATVTLAVNHLPSHNHAAQYGQYLMVDTGDHQELQGLQGGVSFSEIGRTGVTANTGDNQPHNNMPPYRSVYMWRRTA